MIGIDHNQSHLEDARTRVTPATRLVRASLEDIPLETSSIAIAFSHKIYQLENERKYPKIAREIYRILKPGGIYFSDEDMEKYTHAFLQCGLIVLGAENSTSIYQK
ncbi:MAG: class I SAM-dependent methyltransferase [Nanoarchaeota archaeon]